MQNLHVQQTHARRSGTTMSHHVSHCLVLKRDSKKIVPARGQKNLRGLFLLLSFLNNFIFPPNYFPTNFFRLFSLSHLFPFFSTYLHFPDADNGRSRSIDRGQSIERANFIRKGRHWEGGRWVSFARYVSQFLLHRTG